MGRHGKPKCPERTPPESHDFRNSGKPTWQKSTDGKLMQLIQVKACEKCDEVDAKVLQEKAINNG